MVATGSYDAPARALLTAGLAFSFNDKHGQPSIPPLVKHELVLTNEYGKLLRLLGGDLAPPDGQLPLFGGGRPHSRL